MQLTISQAGHKVARPTLLAVLVLCTGLLASAAMAKTASTSPDESGLGVPTTSQPNYADVTDVLNGQRILADVTDLAGSWFLNQGPRNSQTTILSTNQGGISSTTVSTLPAITCFSPGGTTNSPPLPESFRIVRLFNNWHDAILKVTPSTAATSPNCGGENNMWATVQDANSKNDTTITFTLPTPLWLTSAVGDFDFDGFDDVFFIDSQSLFVVSAADTENGQAGVKVFNLQSHGLPSTQTPQADPVSGDFNGDGLIDVAWLGATPVNGSYLRDPTPVVSFATICPGPVAETVCDSATRFQSIVSSATLPINIGGPSVGSSTWTMALTAGNFGTASQDNIPHQLAVGAWFFVPSPYGFDAKVQLYSFDDNLSPTLLSQTTLMNTGDSAEGSSFFLRSFFDWFSGSDQLAVGLSWNDVNVKISVITVDPNSFSMTKHTPISLDAGIQFVGMDVGIMGIIPATNADYTPQIAWLSWSTDVQIGIISIDAADGSYNLKQTQRYQAPGSIEPILKDTTSYFSLLQAGDLQGRSTRLGEPTVIWVPGQVQPAVIIGHPPMHSDYIQVQGQSAPDIVNFSVIQDAYYTEYNLDTTSSTTSSQESTTSNSYTFAESTQEQFKVAGIPLLSGLSASLTQSWTHTAETTASNGSNTFTSTSLDVTSTTGFGDELWLTQYDLYNYVYPVLGPGACPSTIPNCSADQMQPVYVQFSGPDQVTHLVTNGANAEWYQPVHEPGQIFSYPWSEAILDLSVGNLQPLTEALWYTTDDSGEEGKATWTNSNEKEWTTGTTHSHSFDTSNSVTIGTPNLSDKENGVNFTGTFDYNGSSSLSTLNTGSTNVSASYGVNVMKGKDFPNPQLYAYGFAPIITGQTMPVGDIQGNLTKQDLNTSGPFRTAFLVDPFVLSSGNWWSSSPYKCNMDVALNHPQRWQAVPVNPNWPDSCILLSGLNTDCAKFNFPDPADPWNSGFYAMRGLFTTVGAPGGPQRISAMDGDTVYLQARVYNYSLMDMDVVPDTNCSHASYYPNAIVKVRFYRQPWNTNINKPLTGNDSVLIAETTLPPIPGFKSSETTPNWSTVTATLDTTGLGGTSQVFWVLVWAEDGEGQMLPELLGHGLAGNPADTTIHTMADVQLETVDATVDYQGQVPSFSNNVAMLKQVFYVQPAGNTFAESSAGMTAESEPLIGGGELQVENVRLLPRAGKRAVLRADIRSVGGSSDGVMVSFFADDPRLERAFDTENIPYIGADETYRVEVPFWPHDRRHHAFQVIADLGRDREARSARVRMDGKFGESRFLPKFFPRHPDKKHRQNFPDH